MPRVKQWAQQRLATARAKQGGLASTIQLQVLYGRHYATFAEFRTALDGCLAKIHTEHRAPLPSLLTHNFQTFDPASVLAA